MNEFRLEHGKRYVTRDGKHTGPVIDLRQFGVTELSWSFVGSINGRATGWHASGRFLTGEHGSDLVAEYVPPPEPKWVPFTADDFAEKLFGRIVLRKTGNCPPQVIADGDSSFNGEDLCLSPAVGWVSFDKLLADFEFADGTPCGKRVQP